MWSGLYISVDPLKGDIDALIGEKSVQKLLELGDIHHRIGGSRVTGGINV